MERKHEDMPAPAAGKDHLPHTDLISDNGMKLLDTIDDLRRLGIDQDIPLPQIVVVGSQSAGKSSVLEAISGIAFPVNDGQCTTFASEIRLRRTREGQESIAMNIVSKVPDTPVEEKATPLKPSKDTGNANAKNITWDQMPDIINRATKVMGDVRGQKFCDDILRIEVSGPTQDHLSLIDLPGIFHVLKPGEDPKAPARVKATVERYMEEPRSIILAVVSAKDDYSNQEILKTVARIDPSGIRTIGIITGIDLTSEGSARESDYIELARNKLMPLALGWHVVRNLSFEDRKDPNADRDALERAFFSKRVAWLAIPEQDRGASQLKKKLSKTLLAHIGKELGGVITALKHKITYNETMLSQLGPERSTASERRVYLTQLGTRHQSLIKEALDGIYDHPFFALTGQRLRAQLGHEFDVLNDAIASAHRWNFWTLPADDQSHRNYPGIGENQSLALDELTYMVRVDDYLVMVEHVLQQHRGPELQGLFNPRLIGVLFRDQACRWEAIAKSSIATIIRLLELFLDSVTNHLVEQRRAQLLLSHKLIPALQEREGAIQKKLEEIFKPFYESLPQTRSPRFQELRTEGKKQLEQAKEGKNIRPATLKDRGACEGLAIMMQSYYEVSRATFVDNVISLGIEMCLLDGFGDVLSPLSIASMTDQEVAELTSEFAEDAIQRQKARNALRTLRAGLHICREHDKSEFHTTPLNPGLNSSSARPTAPSEDAPNTPPRSVSRHARSSPSTSSASRTPSESSNADSIFSDVEESAPSTPGSNSTASTVPASAGKTTRPKNRSEYRPEEL